MSRADHRRLGDYIREVDVRNRNLDITNLIGLSIQKMFIPSISNTIGTDMSTYRVIKQNQFAYCPVTSRNGEKITVALYDKKDTAIISQAYNVFEIADIENLLPQYLMIWFRRPEFDRYARFKSHGSVREMFDWEEMCNVELPIPSIKEQYEIVAEYNTVQKRIDLNNQLIQKLEETAQAIYKQWFVDFEFPDENGKPYKSNGGEMVESEMGEIPKCWKVGTLEELKLSTLGGDWGKESAVDNYSKEVFCIRGTDIPLASIGQRGNLPTRFILAKNLASRKLEPFDIVTEISGGSPIQSTGRSVLLTGDYLEYLDKNIICSNFCRIIKAKKNYAVFLYSTIVDLYKSNILFTYENSSNGVKNLAIEDLFREKIIVIPDTVILNEFNTTFLKSYEYIMKLGRENEKIMELKDLLFSKLSTIENK